MSATSPSELQFLLKSIGLVLKVHSATAERTFSGIEFDKLGVLVGRTLFSNQDGSVDPVTRINCPLDLLPGLHGHGLAHLTDDGRGHPIYLIELIQDLGMTSYVSFAQEGKGWAVLGLPTFGWIDVRPSMLASGLKQCKPEQIRALGTHCNFSMLCLDIEHQISYVKEAMQRNDPKRVRAALGECYVKSKDNKQLYAAGRTLALRDLAGDVRVSFEQRHDSPEEIWGHALFGDIQDSVLGLHGVAETWCSRNSHSLGRQLATKLNANQSSNLQSKYGSLTEAACLQELDQFQIRLRSLAFGAAGA